MSQIKTKFIENSAVTTAKINNDAVTNDKIADNAVDSLQINANAVTTAKIAADAVTGAKIRLDNNQFLRGRNAANSADKDLLKVRTDDETELMSLGYKLSLYQPTWWGADGVGLLKSQNSGLTDLLLLATEDHANNSTDAATEIFISTGEKPGASSTGSTGGISMVTGANAGSGDSGGFYFETGDKSSASAGSSGDWGAYTGSAAAGASGQLYLESGAVSGGSGNSGQVLLKTGNAAGSSGKSGDIALQIGSAGTAGQGNILMTANTVRIPNQSSDPTLNLLEGGMYWNSTSNKLRVFNGTAFEDVAGSNPTPNKETFTLSAGDITNQYIDLAQVAQTGSIHFLVKGAGVLLEGASHDYSVSYTGGAGGKTRITFLNDIATGGSAALVAADVVQVVYIY